MSRKIGLIPWGAVGVFVSGSILFLLLQSSNLSEYSSTDKSKSPISSRQITRENVSETRSSKTKIPEQFIDSRGEIRRIDETIKEILDGGSLLNFSPGSSDLAATYFYRELHRALWKDVQETMDYSKIKSVLVDLNSQKNGISSNASGFLLFLASLKTDLGPAVDFSEKVSMVKSLDPKMRQSQFESFLKLLGSQKSPGHLDLDTLKEFSSSEMKALVTGLTQSGDLSVIDTVVSQQGESNDELLSFAARELMRAQPGKSTRYFDEITDQRVREHCMRIAVESMRSEGAHLEAEEWAKKIDTK